MKVYAISENYFFGLKIKFQNLHSLKLIKIHIEDTIDDFIISHCCPKEEEMHVFFKTEEKAVKCWNEIVRVEDLWKDININKIEPINFK